MVLQERDIEVLANLAHFFMLNARQIRELSFTADTTGRITRRRLTKMVHAGLVRRRSVQVVSPHDGSVSPVYHLTKSGREFLAGHFDDDRLLAKPVEPSQPQHLFHYVAVSETHRLIDQAVASAGQDVQLLRWINEDEVVNPDQTERSARRQLRTEFHGGSRVVCLPDAAFLLEFEEQRAVFYLEQDRDTYFHDRVAARKTPGYQRLLETRGHRSHFPDTTLDSFLVLVIAPTVRRATQLRKGFLKKNRDHDARRIYRFGALEELNSVNFLFEPLYECCHREERAALIRKPE